MNAANNLKGGTRPDMTEWAKLFIGNWARNWNFAILTNWVCTNKGPSEGIRPTKFSGILTYKKIPLSETEDLAEKFVI